LVLFLGGGGDRGSFLAERRPREEVDKEKEEEDLSLSRRGTGSPFPLYFLICALTAAALTLIPPTERLREKRTRAMITVGGFAIRESVGSRVLWFR